MDDLDHSMHIADHDWASFYEETEECGLMQPVLARPDDWSLSDSEESENSKTGKVGPQQSPAANAGESNAAGCRVEGVQIDQGCSGRDDLRETAEEGSERQRKSGIRSNYPAIGEVGVHMRAAKLTSITTTEQTEQVTFPSPDGESTELRREGGDVQTESGTSSTRERDPLSRSQRELHGIESQIPHTTLSSEKERWFVTVNEGRARQRMRVTSGEKKRRPKEPCKNNSTCLGQEKSGGNVSKVEINYESEGWKDTDYVTQSGQNSGEHPRSEENPESHLTGVVSDSTSGPGDNLSDELITTGRNKTDPGSTSHDTLTATSQGLDSGKSDELELLSVRCCDSHSCPSANESAEEPQQLAKATQQQCSCLRSLTESTDDTQDTETHARHNTCSFDVTACDCEGGGCTDFKVTFPSAAKPLNKMPHDKSTCDHSTHGVTSGTPGLQKHEINLSASVVSSGDPPHLPPAPEVTLTPCSVADSPETYAIAAGHTRPVYAISAFWDEMEKLTINDILHLRLGGNTQKTPDADDFPTNPSSLVDTVEYNLPEGGLMDTSDTADSDYFTQLDESKPDRSSCDFSTSDFEEDYWQFLGTSRNASPDPQIGSPCPACEEAESTASEGKETPVPLDDFAGGRIEDQESDVFVSSNLVWPRRITKSKSVHNVQALNTEDLSLLGNDENSPFLCSSSSLEGNVLLKAIDSLETQIPEPFLSNTDALDERIPASFPRVSEYFLTQDKTKRDSRSVVLYNPEDISVTPVCDHIFTWMNMDEALFSSSLSSLLSSQEKPIPIFSYSHPVIRELTFPNYIFQRVGCEEEEEAGISPVGVVPHSLMRDSGRRGSAAAPHALHSWKSLLPIRKISFHDKGSIWRRASGDWVFPIEAQKVTIEGEDPPITVLAEGGICSSLPQFYRDIPITSKSELAYVAE